MTQHQYTIAPSDMAFHALTTSLYKDRLRAPVREILSNSIDSQNRLGQTRSIEIKLPTALDTQFRIRDYGSGLSKGDMKRLYSSLFSSDKHLTRPNEVGGFGVGAKSPFAYTDAFTVESYYNGKHTVYSAFMDGNRAPQLLELFEQDTKEPNGLAVSYPIAKDDISALVQVVRQEVAICGHPVDCIGAGQPIVTLETNPKFEKIGSAWLGSDSSFLPKTQSREDYYESRVKSFVRMGNVVYPLGPEKSFPKDLANLMALVHRALHEEGERAFMEFGHRNNRAGSSRDRHVVIFDAPIGAVRPAMSREELVLNDPLTIQGLMNVYLTTLAGIYLESIEENNSAKCVRLLKEYEDASLSWPDPRLPSGLAKELATQIAQMETIAKKVEQEEALWKPRALMVHPRLIEMLTHESRHSLNDPYPSNGRSDPFGFHPVYLAGAFMPVGHRAHGIDVSINSPDITLVLIPHTQAGRVEMLHAMSGSKNFGFGYGSKSGSGMRPNDFMELVKTLGKLDRKNLQQGHYFGDVLLLAAQSKENEAQLYQLARENGKNLHVLDIPNRSINVVEPTALMQPTTASPTDPANPYGAPLAAIEPFIAHYWDQATDTMVETTLTQLPLYCVARAHEDESVNADEQILRNWQAVVGPNHTLYAVPQETLAMQNHRNGLSHALQEVAKASVHKGEKPASVLEWTMASINLPREHPFYRPEHVQYVQDHRLLSELKRHCMGGQYNYYSSRRYTDYGWDEETKMGVNPMYDASLLEQYPLLQAFSRELCNTAQFDAVHQYIALVDRMNGHDYSAPVVGAPEAPAFD